MDCYSLKEPPEAWLVRGTYIASSLDQFLGGRPHLHIKTAASRTHGGQMQI